MAKDELKELAESAIKELEDKKYERDAIFRYAKAAKSWCVRDSQEWKMWEIVIEMTSP